MKKFTRANDSLCHRLCYVAGREGHVPSFFSWVHYERMTPAAAVTLQGLLSLFFMLVGDILKLIDFASFLIWVFYGLSMVALIIMRRTKPDVKRPYRVPIFIPWLVLVIAIFLTVMPIIDNPSLMYLLVLFFILLGCSIYHFYVYNKRKSRFARKFIFRWRRRTC